MNMDRLKMFEAIQDQYNKLVGKNLPMNLDCIIGVVMTEIGFKGPEVVLVVMLNSLPSLVAHAMEEMTTGHPLRVVGDPIAEYTGPEERKLPKEKIQM